jgi:hypothetical protein
VNSLPVLFLVLAGTALAFALVAIYRSMHAALGGDPDRMPETARDLPGRAALVEEKNLLLRAIKDLEYERAVGKIGDADFQRFNAAYRARAKQLLAELDRDVRPFYEEAERLIEAHLAGARQSGESSHTKGNFSADPERPA